MFRFPKLSAAENEAVSRIDNIEPLYIYVTERCEDIVKQDPDTYELRMRAVDIIAQALRENVLPKVAGSYKECMREDIIAEHYLATACKDLE